MKIGPANSTTPLIGDKQEAANRKNQGLEKRDQTKTREDQLNISSRARELQANHIDKSKILAETENIADKKLDLIRLKVSNRYYDKPQTKLKIAEKLTADKEILREFYKSIY